MAAEEVYDEPQHPKRIAHEEGAMYGESARRKSLRGGLVVTFATLVAMFLPTSAMSLNQATYPLRGSPNPFAIARVASGWSEPEVVQFEPVTFYATLIYGVEGDPTLPSVEIAYSNAATLTAENPAAFVISPGDPVTKTLDTGTVRPEGGYELTWAWDVTAREVGPQKLLIHFVPEVFVDGVRLDVPDRNDDVAVDVRVHPQLLEFQKVVESADAGMETDVPDDMTVGQDYEVSASFPLTDADVDADIDIAEAENSVEVTIREAKAEAALASVALGTDAVVTRRWVVTPNATGQVSLVFTARLRGEAGEETIEDTVERTNAALAEAPPPSVWDVIGTPVTVIGGILAALVAALGLVVGIRKLLAGRADEDEDSAGDKAERKEKAPTPARGAKDAGR